MSLSAADKHTAPALLLGLLCLLGGAAWDQGCGKLRVFQPQAGEVGAAVQQLRPEHAAPQLLRAFVTGKLIGRPGVLRTDSHLAMKKLKADY